MAKQQRYKRSWKNYLLDANYQLRFTLTMVVVAAGLMAPLGYWVSQKADRATEVALNQLDGIRCPDALVAMPAGAEASAIDGDPIEEDLLEGEDPAPADGGTAELESEGAEGEQESGALPETVEKDAEAAAESAADTSEDDPDAEEDRERRPRPAIVVEIDDSEMPDEPVVVVGSIETPGPSAAEIAQINAVREMCFAHITREKKAVVARKDLIGTVMIVSGLFLLFGLGLYGIKTTHKVAGPLFKVGLYLAKVERNVYDTVYNLRKGDQLVEFYSSFKGAHAGLTTMQEADRDRLRDAIALAKDADLAAKDPEVAALVKELESLLAETEKSLGQE